jgi:hypothetical protein
MSYLNDGCIGRTSGWNPLAAISGQRPTWIPGGPHPQNTRAVPPENITIAGLGKLGTDGYLYTASLADDDTVDVTPSAPPKHYTWVEGASKYELVIQCKAQTPSDRERTTVGVGEEVELKFRNLDHEGLAQANYPKWGKVGGGLDPPAGTRANGVWYSASSNATTDRVMANFTNAGGGSTVTLTTVFTVKEPTGYDSQKTAVTAPDCSIPVGQAGAGMYIHVVMAPTDVSLYKVQIMEVGQPASSVSNYFVGIAPPHDTAHLANQWYQLNEDNSWKGVDDHAYSGPWAPSTMNPPSWAPGGGYTWLIPVDWKVGDSAPTHRISGWSQTHSLSSDGTMIVKKFGDHTATRGPDQPCSVAN